MVRNFELLESKIEDRYVREAFRRVRRLLKDQGTSGDFTSIRNTIINEIGETDVAKLIFTKKAAVNIGAFQMVYLINTNEVSLTDNSGYAESIAVGIAIESKTAGNDIRILTFGIAEDPSFTYAINEKLFLGILGSITNVPPSNTAGKFVTPIGQSLGTGAIFIRIQEPEEVI